MLLLLACRHPVPPVGPESIADPLLVAYAAGLEDARDALPSEVVDTLLPLTPETEGLRWDVEGRLLVQTWTRSSYYADPSYTAGYSFGLYGETWLTTGHELSDACAGLSGADAALRLEQLLGLPPDGGRDVFLQVWIDPSALFRPCADPSITATTCPVAAPLVAGSEDSVSWSCGQEDDEHTRWLCDTWVNRYSPSQPLQRYPWTALGYTYDWGRPGDPVGASEFVAPGGTTVVFEALIANDDFCAP